MSTQIRTVSSLFVGFVTASRLSEDDARALVSPTIRPPGNMSKPETIAKWEAEVKPAAIEAAADGLRYSKTFATLERIYAIDPLGKEVFDSDDCEYVEPGEERGPNQYYNPSHAFYNWLHAKYADSPGWDRRTYDKLPFEIYGFDPKVSIRAFGMDLGTLQIPVPRHIWYANDAVYDVYDMVVDKDYREYLSPSQVCSLFNIDQTESDAAFAAGKQHMSEALLALSFAVTFGLLADDRVKAAKREDAPKAKSKPNRKKTT